MKLLIASVLVLASCSALKSRRIPGIVNASDEVLSVQKSIWTDSYKQGDYPPTVFVVGAADLTCEDGTMFQCPTVGCVYGCTASPIAVHIARTTQQWHETSLAHEDMHALKLRQELFGLLYSPDQTLTDAMADRNHTGPEWEPGGEVDVANARLAALGY